MPNPLTAMVMSTTVINQVSMLAEMNLIDSAIRLVSFELNVHFRLRIQPVALIINIATTSDAR